MRHPLLSTTLTLLVVILAPVESKGQNLPASPSNPAPGSSLGNQGNPQASPALPPAQPGQTQPGPQTGGPQQNGTAQQNGPAQQNGANGAAQQQAPGKSAARPATVFPPLPQPFFRGHPPGSGPRPVIGWYINLWRFGIVLAGFALWLSSANWAAEDSRALKVRTEFWNSVILGGGLAGLLFSVCAPNFYIGLGALVAGYGLPLGLYVNERNGRVPESSKVMTPAHIKKVAIRTLARVGINISGGERIDRGSGPPITFIGRSSTGTGDDTASSRQVEKSKGYMAARELVYDAILRRGTDLHLEPKEGEVSIRMRVDGVMYPVEPFDKPIGEAVVNIFKVLSAMDITEKRRPQDGSFRAEMEDRDIDFRVATAGTRFGEKLVMRILDQSSTVASLKELGFRKQLLEQMDEVVNEPHGMFLTCGPTGAGKSTTLYAALHSIDAYQRNIITVEDPIEYKMANVNQIEVNQKAGNTFAKALRSILRQDPDVVMIGEIRDLETAEIACQAANTGHMVFSTLHANESIAALYRLLELGLEPFMIANSITVILAQRLARKLCPECKVPYKPKPELLKKAGLPVSKIDKFYRPPKNGEDHCTKCDGRGYYGRVGVFEALFVNDRMRDMIREKAPMSALKAEARKNGMLTMKEEGLRLVVRGVTSIEELLRVVK